MNYGKNEVEKTLRKTNSRSQKITSHLVLLLTKIILILVLFAAVLGISFGYGIFKGVIDAAPSQAVMPPWSMTVRETSRKRS